MPSNKLRGLLDGLNARDKARANARTRLDTRIKDIDVDDVSDADAAVAKVFALHAAFADAADDLDPERDADLLALGQKIADLTKPKDSQS